MNSILKMAWRNLWRNKRRTLITTASIFFAIFFAILMRSMQLGAYGHMYKSVIESYTGYIQIQQKDYWDDRTIDNGFFLQEDLKQKLLDHENVTGLIPHTETFALAANENQTKVSMVIGIDPAKENEMSKLQDKLVKYRLTEDAVENILKTIDDEDIIKRVELKEGKSYASKDALDLDLAIPEEDFEKLFPIIQEYGSYESQYLTNNDDGILLGDRLSKYLKVNTGDTLVLLGQGYHGVSAVGKYPIRGIIRIPNPEIDNLAIYMTNTNCSAFIGVENFVSSLILEVDEKQYEDIEKTTAELNELLAETGFVAKDWRKLNEVMVQQIESDNAGGAIMLIILYLVIAFGVFGTVLMMTAERRREFGVLISIGLQKSKLAIVIGIEMIYLGILGIISGALLSVPIVYFGNKNPMRMEGEMAKAYEGYGFEPIMPMQWFGDYYYDQAIVVLVIVLLAIIYPVIKIFKLKEIQALRA